MDRINYQDRGINRSSAFEPAFAAEPDEEGAGRDERLVAEQARFGPQLIELGHLERIGLSIRRWIVFPRRARFAASGVSTAQMRFISIGHGAGPEARRLQR
jgi:hypothetical protein